MLLLQILSQFEKEGIEHLVSGGYALCLNGAIRPTLDIDILAPKELSYSEKLNSLQWNLKAFDFLYTPEFSTSNQKTFRRSNHEILNIHLDPLFFSYRVKNIRILSHQISILHPLDLIKIKKINASPQNILDIKALEAIYE